jgi:hypothetical protein
VLARRIAVDCDGSRVVDVLWAIGSVNAFRFGYESSGHERLMSAISDWVRCVDVVECGRFKIGTAESQYLLD